MRVHFHPRRFRNFLACRGRSDERRRLRVVTEEEGVVRFSPFLPLSLSLSVFLRAVHRTQDGKQRIPFTNSTANYALTSRGFTPVWMRSRGLRAPPPQGLRLNRHLVCSGCSAPPLSLAPSFPSFLPCSPRTSTSFFSICAKLAGNYAGLIYS